VVVDQRLARDTEQRELLLRVLGGNAAGAEADELDLASARNEVDRVGQRRGGDAVARPVQGTGRVIEDLLARAEVSSPALDRAGGD
jgi:hypothetical protein